MLAGNFILNFVRNPDLGNQEPGFEQSSVPSRKLSDNLLGNFTRLRPSNVRAAT